MKKIYIQNNNKKIWLTNSSNKQRAKKLKNKCTYIRIREQQQTSGWQKKFNRNKQL